MRHKKNAVERDRGYVFEIVKANIIALIVALIAILVSALIVKIFTVSDGAIPIINQVIKSVSIFIGCLISLKKPNTGGCADLFAALYLCGCHSWYFPRLIIIFVFGLSLLNDCVLGGISGMISGIIAVNIRKH